MGVDTEPPRPYLLQFASKMLPTATRMSFFKNLFKEAGVKDVITLFHAPSVPASMRAHAILKQAAATAQSSATEDQASDHDNQSRLQRTDFNLDVQETPPTPDQLTSILDYLGPSKLGLSWKKQLEPAMR